MKMTSEKPVTMPGSLSLSDRPPPPGVGYRGAAVPAVVTGKPMMMSGSGSVVLPAGMINPAVPIRNIKMKFAVLTGLIQVGEVSNRDIVETVLNLVSSYPAHYLLYGCTLLFKSTPGMIFLNTPLITFHIILTRSPWKL